MRVKVIGSRSLLTKWKFSNIWSKSVGRRRKVALVHKIVNALGLAPSIRIFPGLPANELSSWGFKS